MVQWLGLYTPNAGGMGSTLGWKTKILHGVVKKKWCRGPSSSFAKTHLPLFSYSPPLYELPSSIEVNWAASILRNKVFAPQISSLRSGKNFQQDCR